MALGRGGPACITSRWAAASRPHRRLRGREMVGTVYHSLDVLALSAGLFALRRSHEPQKLPVHQTGSTPRLQERGGADESQRHDMDAGRGEASAAASRIP